MNLAETLRLLVRFRTVLAEKDREIERLRSERDEARDQRDSKEDRREWA